GATLVIHEVAIPNQEFYEKTSIVRYIMAHHISPEEAGALFARLKPKLAAYTHLVFLGSPDFRRQQPPTSSARHARSILDLSPLVLI
ncbi:MAG: hypothetical protein WCE32_13060, partial [Pseudolabrys sp.]